MTDQDIHDILTTDTTGLAADAEQDAPDHSVKYAVRGSGHSTTLHDDFETADGQARLLSEANPDATFYVMQSVKLYAPRDIAFEPLHKKYPFQFKRLQSKLPKGATYYKVLSGGGNLAGMWVEVRTRAQFNRLMWLVHPCHLSPVSEETMAAEIEDENQWADLVVKPEGFKAPVGTDAFDERVAQRRPLMSVLPEHLR